MNVRTSILTIASVSIAAIGTIFVKNALNEGRHNAINDIQKSELSKRSADEAEALIKLGNVKAQIENFDVKENDIVEKDVADFKASISYASKVKDANAEYKAKVDEFDYEKKSNAINTKYSEKISEWKTVHEYDSKLKTEDDAIKTIKNSYEATKSVLKVSDTDNSDLVKKMLNQTKKLRDEQIDIHESNKDTLVKEFKTYEKEINIAKNKEIHELDLEYSKIKSEAAEDKLKVVNDLYRQVKEAKDRSYEKIQANRTPEEIELRNEYNKLISVADSVENRETAAISSAEKLVTKTDALVAYMNANKYSKVKASFVLCLPLFPIMVGMYKYVDWCLSIIRRVAV